MLCSNVQRILATWEAGLLPASLAAWGEREAALAAAFEQHRAARMRGDANGWLALNPLYEGVAEALRECPYPYYIASSKAANRLVSLLRASSLNLDVDEQSPRLFASLLPPNEKKIAALRWVWWGCVGGVGCCARSCTAPMCGRARLGCSCWLHSLTHR